MCELLDELSQHSLITGQPKLKYGEIVTLTLGEYLEVYATNNVINNNEECTTNAIALSRNLQQGWIFTSLNNTRRTLHRQQ